MNIREKYNHIIELGKVLNGKTDVDEILISLADFSRDILEVDRCSVFVYDPDKNELYTKIAQGLDKEIRIDASSGVAGWTATTKDVQIIYDAYSSDKFNKEIDYLTGYKTKNIISVPLIGKNGNAIGVFQALNKKNGKFSEHDIDALLLFGTYASSILENAILTQKLQITKTKIIGKLSMVVEYKDNETSAHVKRVGAYSYFLAKELGLNSEEARLIKLAAPMHDTGKIGILDKILHKPSRLTKNEFEDMKQHTTIGYQILYDKDVPLLMMAAIIAKEHHEKYDGSGYPDGLSGDDISVYARIVSIADVYDALTSNRAYKKAWDVQKAREYIVSQSGISFDPKLVKIFDDNFTKILDIAAKI